MANNMRLSLILSANDRLSSVIRTSVAKSEKAFDNFEKKIDDISGKYNRIGQRSLIAGTAMLASSGVMLKSAADFETSMSSVSTLIDTNAESMQEMNKEVLQIGKRTPVALDQLTSALYDIRSAGISASDQFNVLEKSAQLGVAGLGTTSQAVDLVTSSINAFKLKGEEQNKLYDNIFKTIKTGKTTISQLAQGFGAVAGTVAAAGIKIDDYLASVAALTTTGQPAAQAHTQMKAAIAGLTRNTKEQQAVFHKLGAKDFNDLIKKSGSVVAAFSGINTVVKGNKAKLIELLGSVEAYNAVLSLTGNQNAAYATTINEMRYGADAFSEAYQKKLYTVNAQLQRGRNLVAKIGIDWGTYLIPPFMKALNVVEKVMNKVDVLPEGVKQFAAVGTAATGIGLIAFGGLSLAAGAAVKSIGNVAKAYRTMAFFIQNNKVISDAFKSIKLTLWTSGTFRKGLLFVKNSIISLPQAILKCATAIKVLAINSLELSKNAILSIPKRLADGFTTLKSGLLNIPTMLRTIIANVKTLNLTLTLNPMGLAVVGIVAGAVLIMKYWVPIKAFFHGLWSGIIEGTRPLHPAIKRITASVKPLFNWFSKLLEPINTTGARAENWGLKIGRIIGGVVTWCAKLADKILTLNGLWKNAPWRNKNEHSAVVLPKVDGSHAGGLASVPFDGYIAELHKGERVLTAKENREIYNGSNNRKLIRADFSQNRGDTYVFNPQIYANGKDLKEIEALIDRKQREFFNRIQTEKRRKEVRQYA